MVPFRVFDRNKKQTWQVINYQPGAEGGFYLVAREDESEIDGDMSLLPASEIVEFKFEGFIEEEEAEIYK
tara:strand:+ start:180 stop:389 length:210 start_codon:yes stop_codon:yes gene_type:complete